MASALAAIAELARVVVEADSSRIVVCGHSMGGHGALLLAARLGDRLLGLSVSAGWLRKSDYGDANTLWKHEVALHETPSALRAVLEASDAAFDADAAVSNLCHRQSRWVFFLGFSCCCWCCTGVILHVIMGGSSPQSLSSSSIIASSKESAAAIVCTHIHQSNFAPCWSAGRIRASRVSPAASPPACARRLPECYSDRSGWLEILIPLFPPILIRIQHGAIGGGTL
jgi:hypothetical protein